MTPSTHPAPYPRLLADVGGTNARFGWVERPGDAPHRVRALPTQAHAGIAEAVRSYLQVEGLPMPPAMGMGIATPITGDAVQMTNHHWAFSIQRLQGELGLQRLAVINDFTALALALPTLQAADLRQVGGTTARPRAPIAVLGPGTGLGVSGLLPTGASGWTALTGEGGHVTLPGVDARESDVLALLRSRYGHASAERALSGAGVVALYEAICHLDGTLPQGLRPADVTQRALAGTERACTEALEIFCALLGTVSGDLALTLGALGGVYIGGGIVPRLGDFFVQSRFRERFEAKGRYRAYLRPIPVYVIQATDSPALVGTNRALDAG